MHKDKVEVYKYNEQVGEVIPNITSLKEIHANRNENEFLWINFPGLHFEDLMNESFEYFKIHRLLRTDIKNTKERPKIEESDNLLFVSFKSVLEDNRHKVRFEQISFVLTDHALIAYQEKPKDNFDEIRERIVEGKGIVRSKKADYLLYLLLDATLLSYHKELEKIVKRVDKLDDLVLKDFDKSNLDKIEHLKSSLRELRKVVSPFKEQLNRLGTIDIRFIDPKNKPYFNDLKDQVLFLLDEIENEKSELEKLTNYYFSSVSHHANEVMKTLTIIASIFIPLTFIAGVYGMNFKNIPETETQYGYYVIWGVMIIIGGLLFYYFKRKKWF